MHDVRFLVENVRFTPESGHVQCNSACPLCANSGHSLPANTRAASLRAATLAPREYARQGATDGENHCIWSSMSENAALSLSAFLISSQLT
jgi:hypothetical protein